MPPIELGVLTDANNVKVLDAIRNDASLDYQNRVPSATQAGIDVVMKNITEYRPQYNEFENAFVNRIGMMIGRSKSWQNPLAEFKIGMLTWGDTIEEYQVGLLKAHTYDGNRDYMERAIFGREMPEVQANFHTVNRQEYYRVTVNEAMLHRAFLSQFGLSEYAAKLMDAPIQSDNWDEFLISCRLFREYEDNGGFFKVNVPDVSVLTSTESEAKQVLRVIRGIAGEMQFLSTTFNAAKMPMHASPDELVLFCTPAFQAALDVNALAAAFNIDRAQVPNRIVLIPDERFDIDGCQAILTTRDFFVIADQKMENTSQFNPVGLGTNYFWHHWQVISTSRFVPAVMFTTKPGTVVVSTPHKLVSIDSVSVTDIDGKPVVAGAVTRGMTYQCLASVTTSPVGSTLNHGVTWSIVGHESSRTTISQTGVLRISGTESATQITVSAFDSNENGNAGLVSVDLALTPSGASAPEWPVTP